MYISSLTTTFWCNIRLNDIPMITVLLTILYEFHKITNEFIITFLKALLITIWSLETWFRFHFIYFTIRDCLNWFWFFLVQETLIGGFHQIPRFCWNLPLCLKSRGLPFITIHKSPENDHFWNLYKILREIVFFWL